MCSPVMKFKSDVCTVYARARTNHLYIICRKVEVGTYVLVSYEGAVAL